MIYKVILLLHHLHQVRCFYCFFLVEVGGYLFYVDKIDNGTNTAEAHGNEKDYTHGYITGDKSMNTGKTKETN